ncbi:MAG TPA: nucleotidyltransferase domain-containing protein [bacterium]|nr:nucleotidyltransferase domain-containing protein [bacterium]
MTGTKTAQPNAAGLPVLEGLFGSKSRARLLTIFVSHPAEEFYAQRLTTMTRLAESSVRYELGRLEKLGVLVARRAGREKNFRINDRHPLLPELKQMVYKTAGLGETIRQAVDGMPNIQAAFIFGSVAKGGEQATSDIDLFILGRPDQTRLAAALSEAEGRLGREINLVTMAPDEWRRRRNAGEGFINEVLRSPKIFLVGDEQSLR